MIDLRVHTEDNVDNTMLRPSDRFLTTESQVAI